MTTSLSVSELASRVGGTLRGAGTTLIRGVADVAEAGADELTFITNPSYAKRLPTSAAGAVLVPEGFGPTPMPAILCQRVDRALARVLAIFAPSRSAPDVGIHPTAVLGEDVAVGRACAIGPHVVVGPQTRIGAGSVISGGAYIGRRVTLGENCHIGPNAVVADDFASGDRVVLLPAAVIGGDGFGFYFDEGRHHRVPHIGRVILEDDVEVGACACIDRAKFGVTRIGKGTKIDNLVQVGHNVRIGAHCVLAGQAGLSGSSRVGDYCVIGGRGGMIDGVSLGDRVVVAALAVASKNVPAGTTILGFPAQDIRAEKRERARLRRLPKFYEKIQELTARIEQLEAAKDDQSRDDV